MRSISPRRRARRLTAAQELELARSIQEGEPVKASGSVAALMNAHLGLVREAGLRFADKPYHDDVLESACVALQFAAFTYKVPSDGPPPRFEDHARPLIEQAIGWAHPDAVSSPS